jgi:hypothetical protein
MCPGARNRSSCRGGCCHLQGGVCFGVFLQAVPVDFSQSPELGLGRPLSISSFIGIRSRGLWRSKQRLVDRSRRPQFVQQHGELPSHGDHRALLAVLTSP